MGWQVKKLSDVCQFQNGFAFKSSLFSDTGVPILRISNIQDGVIDLKRIVYTDPASYSENLDKYLVRDGELLIAMSGATTGKIGINQTGLVFFLNQRVGKFIPSEKLNPQYLYYYLSTKVEEHLEKSAGSAQPNLSTEQIKGLELPVPPLQEQKRIVAILDEVFADIEQARAKTEQNLKNARELFESYLQQVFSQRGDGWEELTLGQATGGVFTGPFGSLLHKSDYIENGIPLVNPAHITSTGIEPDLRKTISSETAQRLSSYLMSEGDIVIGRRGEMGRCALITSEEDGYLCGTGSFLIKSSERVSSDYLVRYLRSSVGRARLEQVASGAVMLNLSNAELSNLSLYFPPINRQKEIIKTMGHISVQVESIVQVYQNKLTALDELKQSILQKAFSGELTQGASKEEVA